MSTVVDARLPAEEFALVHSLRENPESRFEICRVVANTTDTVMPFVWGSGADIDSLRESLRADPTTQDVQLVSEGEGEYLFKMEWMARVALLFDVFLVEEEATLLDAHCSGEEWRFRLVLPDDQCVRSVCDECEDLGLSLDVERAFPLSQSFTHDQFQLTEKQYEAVMAAYEEGYYDVPREINLKELARRLDLSHQALSERLRRGHEALIANGLGVAPEGSVVAGPVPESGSNESALAQLGTGEATPGSQGQS